tara:strand:+ start:694 stop:1740 length:1047 start_codon:yes stop_codon:yes gene_type:complete
MADTQQAPQPAGLQPIPALGGSILEAQEALLSLEEPEEEKPKEEEAAPAEEEESTEETQDESLEEESEEESEEVEEEEAEESDEEEEEDPLYAVTVNGEEHEVTFDELLRGYSRQSDYTRKTQELSTERKQMEELQQQYTSEVSQIQSERQQYMENLQQILQNSAGEMEKFTNVDWASLKESDPIEYVTKKEELREAQEKVQTFKNEQELVRQKQYQDAELMRKTIMTEEHGKLVSALPDWGDPDKQKKIASDIKAYGLTQGFTQEELGSLIDHRSVLVLIKALKYDTMQSSDVKSKKLKNKPKVIRSGKGRSSSQAEKGKRTAQMKRLRGTGHIDDASALLEDFIDI